MGIIEYSYDKTQDTIPLYQHIVNKFYFNSQLTDNYNRNK